VYNVRNQLLWGTAAGGDTSKMCKAIRLEEKEGKPRDGAEKRRVLD